jgi:hypothetical protein
VGASITTLTNQRNGEICVTLARSIPPDEYPALNQRLHRLNQGHLISHSTKVHKELHELSEGRARRIHEIESPELTGKGYAPELERLREIWGKEHSSGFVSL